MKIKQEGNYTQIPNVLIETIIKSKLTASDINIFLAICRQTYGWHKDYAWISGAAFTRFTYYPTPYVFRIVRKLEEHNLISVNRYHGGYIKHISIQANTDAWFIKYRRPVAPPSIPQDIHSTDFTDISTDYSQDIHKRNKEISSERNIYALLDENLKNGE